MGMSWLRQWCAEIFVDIGSNNTMLMIDVAQKYDPEQCLSWHQGLAGCPSLLQGE
jgi:hypothetical protein